MHTITVGSLQEGVCRIHKYIDIVGSLQEGVCKIHKYIDIVGTIHAGVCRIHDNIDRLERVYRPATGRLQEGYRKAA